MSRSEYRHAVQTGALARSVHFDCRVSKATGLHSLVDIVQYDVTNRILQNTEHFYKIKEEFEFCLDVFCLIDEQVSGLEKVILSKNDKEFREIALAYYSSDQEVSTVQHNEFENGIMSHALESWCRCYRALHKILSHEQSSYGRRDEVTKFESPPDGFMKAVGFERHFHQFS